MPLKEFIVEPMKGLGINGRIDPRNKGVGYICFMKHDINHLHFFISIIII